MEFLKVDQGTLFELILVWGMFFSLQTILSTDHISCVDKFTDNFTRVVKPQIHPSSA